MTLRHSKVSTVPPTTDPLLVSSTNWNEDHVIPQTPAELILGVTPTYLIYDQGNVARYGALGGGTINDAASIQTAINVMAASGGGEVIVPKPIHKYNTGSTTLNVPGQVVLKGVGMYLSYISYSGTGYAISVSSDAAGVQDMYIGVSDPAASGIKYLGGNVNAYVQRVYVAQEYGGAATNITGSSIEFTNVVGDNHFAGLFRIEDYYGLRFKYGIKATGATVNFETWTTITGINVTLVGPSKAAGSVGIYFDAYTNGVGSTFKGGSIEGFEYPGQVVSGGFGYNWEGDVEGNTVDRPLLADTASLIWWGTPNGYYRNKGSDNVNQWYDEEHKLGEFVQETYYSQRHVVLSVSGLYSEFGVYRGPSIIKGNSPTPKFKVVMGTDTAGHNNYLQINNSRLAWGGGSTPGSNPRDLTDPSVLGSWDTGDVWFDITATSGGAAGSICTTAGSIGTAVFTQIPLKDSHYSILYMSTGGQIRWNDSTPTITENSGSLFFVAVGSVGFQNATSGTITLAPIAGALGTVTLSLPAATDTLVGKATTDELTNKTLTSSVGKGTWTASGTWTLPAYTLGGTISGGGNQINNVIIGASTPLAGHFTTIDTTGKVGIGAAVGSAALLVMNNGSNDQLDFGVVGEATSGFYRTDAAGFVFYGNSSTVGANTPISFYTGAGVGDLRLTINGDGTLALPIDRQLLFTNQTDNANGTLATAAGTAGNPAFWLKIKINGTNRAIPVF